jgi:hypothetical protein
VILLERGNSGRNEDDPVEIKFLKSSLGQNQMAEMNGIKGPSKKPHPLHMPRDSLCVHGVSIGFCPF